MTISQHETGRSPSRIDYIPGAVLRQGRLPRPATCESGGLPGGGTRPHAPAHVPIRRLPLRAFGPFVLGRVEALAGSLASMSQVLPEAADRVLILVVRSGALEGCHEGRTLRAEAGDICLFDLSRSAELRVTAPACSVLVVPGYAIEGAAGTLPVEGRVLASPHPLKQIFADHVESLEHNLDGLMASEERLVAETALLLLRGCAPLFFAPHGDAHPKRAAIQGYIEAHLTDHALDTRALTAQFGMSRASLYRIFEPIGGVAEYIRKRRLARVRSEIVAPANRHRRIADIAYEWGFDSGAAFSNLFKRTYGISPREMRRCRDDRTTEGCA